MIPNFNKHGLLPPGIHVADLNEVKERFAYNLGRKKLFEGLLTLINDLKLVNCPALYLDGSYVTSKVIPNDYDACWENTGVDLKAVNILIPILLDPSNRGPIKSRYSADVFPARIMEGGSGKLFIDFFQTCKHTGLKKGIIKINIVP